MQKIASLLLRKNGVPFDKDEFSFQIQSHPSYPSLHAITGVLDHFNIENVAARVPNTQEVFDQLPNHFIAQVNDTNGLELFLTEKQGNSCKLYNTNGKSKSVSTDDFLENFTGIILAVEKDESSSKKVIQKNLLTNIGFILALVCLLAVFSISTVSISFYASFLISAIGILISVSILKQEFGIKNTIGDAFCASDSDKKDCNAVLTSKGATLFKTYKLSDISLIYFTGFTFSVFLLTIQGLNLQLLYLMSLLSLPITIYSIYYQAFTVKTWCLLCLSVVGVLWIQASIPFLFSSFTYPIDFQFTGMLSILVGFLTSFSVWSYLKPKYVEASENKTHKIDYYKFKRKYSLFSTLLKNNAPLNTVIQSKNQIVFGNPESNVEIVIVTNPFCGHCRPVHTLIEDILKKYNDDAKVIIRFNIDITDIHSDVVVITSNLIHIHLVHGQEKSMVAMDEAYNLLSPKEWIKKWSDAAIDIELCHKNLTDQKEWCLENKINFTPEILINGYSFPKEYERTDLSLFIEELSEEYNTETGNHYE